MADIEVQKVKRADDRSVPMLAEAERLIQNIRERAFALSALRGPDADLALDDWLTAERELCWPATEFSEYEKEYRLDLALAGFEPSEIEITATPREVVVHARTKSAADKPAANVKRWSNFGTNDVWRRIEFGSDIDVNRVAATLKNGLLRITAPKQQVQSLVKTVPVANAA
jgi:HSP20 family molecular chaperone IbpA